MRESQKRGNKKYLQKFKTKSIRIPLDDWERIERYYQGKGFPSFANWIMTLIYREIGDAANVQDTGDHGHQDGGAAGDHRDAGAGEKPLDGQIDILKNKG